MNNTAPNWGKKQDEFCLKHKISGCAKLLLRWLVRNPKNCEPDLKSFNNWVLKHREKPFHRDTLKQAFKKLVNVGVVIVKKLFKWHVFRIELVFLWARKKSRSPDCDRDSSPSNPAYSCQVGLQQQPLLTKEQEAIVQQLKIAGIQFENYSPLWEFSEEEIDRAVTYYLQIPNIGDIRNPAGWLLKCLQKKWWRSTFLDTFKVTNPHLIAVAWDYIKNYVKAHLGIDTECCPSSSNLPSPPSPKDRFTQFFNHDQRTVKHDSLGVSLLVKEEW